MIRITYFKIFGTVGPGRSLYLSENYIVVYGKQFLGGAKSTLDLGQAFKINIPSCKTMSVSKNL